MPGSIKPSETRSPMEWLRALQRAKASTSPAKLTIADLIDRSSDPNASGMLEPTSPRSVDACLSLGIEPWELKLVAKHHFERHYGDQELAELAFKHHETLRQERLQALQDERKRIAEDGGQAERGRAHASETGGAVDAAAIIEKEAKRLEVVRRRQERELKQMVQFEAMRKELQEKAEAKLRKVQERAEAERQAKAQQSREWLKQQHERELRRLQEEEEKQKQARKAEAALHEREKEAAVRLAAAEAERRRELRKQEAARAEKVERCRKETARLLAKQQAEVAEKKAAMAARDAEREQARLQLTAAAAERNAAARTKAQERIAAALESGRRILTERREEFSAREQAAEQRRKEKEAARLAEEARARAEEAAKEQQRRRAYAEAQRREADRVGTILSKQQSKEATLRTLGQQRSHEAELRSLQHQLQLDTKRGKVEEMKRRNLYQRMLLLERIQQETEKINAMLERRAALQEQRKAANMEASFQRQRLQESVAHLQARKDWGTGAAFEQAITQMLH